MDAFDKYADNSSFKVIDTRIQTRELKACGLFVFFLFIVLIVHIGYTKFVKILCQLHAHLPMRPFSPPQGITIVSAIVLQITYLCEVSEISRTEQGGFDVHLQFLPLLNEQALVFYI